MTYTEYLEKIARLAKEVTWPGGGSNLYPSGVKSAAQRALFNNVARNEALALMLDVAVLGGMQDDWRNNATKTKRVRNAIRHVLSTDMPANLGLGVQNAGNTPTPTADLEHETDRILELVKHQSGY